MGGWISKSIDFARRGANHGLVQSLVYIYQSRISELHEFIADAQVAKTHKSEQIGRAHV